jgi:hypothetical protein
MNAQAGRVKSLFVITIRISKISTSVLKALLRSPALYGQTKIHGRRSRKDNPKAKTIAATISLLLIAGLIAVLAFALLSMQ